MPANESDQVPEFIYNKKTQRLETADENIFVKRISYRADAITLLLKWNEREIVFETRRDITQSSGFYYVDWEIISISSVSCLPLFVIMMASVVMVISK
jgi:hypothetical protein